MIDDSGGGAGKPTFLKIEEVKRRGTNLPKEVEFASLKEICSPLSKMTSFR